MPASPQPPETPKPADKRIFWNEIQANKRKSYLLVAIVVVVLFALVWVFAEIFSGLGSGIVTFFTLLFVAAYSYVTYYHCDEIVIAATGAKPLDTSNPAGRHLQNLVEGLAIAAGVPVPRVYVVDSPEMNAFATGRDPKHAVVAVTTGLWSRLSRQELEGVIGHEMSHVRNYDIRFATLVAVMVGVVAILSDILLHYYRFGGGRGNSDRKGSGGVLLIIIGLVLAIFAPIIVRFVQAAVSRKRELLADASAVQLTRYPEGLASALEKIGGANKGNMQVNEAVSHLFFVDPVKSSLDDLTATHPPIEERVKLLRSM